MIGDNAWVVVIDLQMDLVTGLSMVIIQTGWMGYSWTVLLIAIVGARSDALNMVFCCWLHSLWQLANGGVIENERK
jgi:hypothetical protein